MFVCVYLVCFGFFVLMAYQPLWVIWCQSKQTVSWGCGIHQLLFCRGVRPPPNECPGYDTKSDGEIPVMLKLLMIQSTPSLPLLLGIPWAGVVAPDRVLSMGQIELNWVLMLNWIAWNRTVLTFKLHTYAKLKCLKWNCFCMLNWIVWNGTVLTFNCV